MNPDKGRETVKLDETIPGEPGSESTASSAVPLETMPQPRRRLPPFFEAAFSALARLLRLKPKSPAGEGMTFSSTLGLTVGQGSHRGSRDQNEDRLGWFSTVHGELFIVADGMGGHNGGQEAAETVLETFREHLEGGGVSEPPPKRITSLIWSRGRSGCSLPADDQPSSPPRKEPNPEDLLLKALLAADRQVYLRGESEPSLAGLGSTVAVLLLQGHEVWYSHVGDSRIYLFRQGRLSQLTRDHSIVQEMIEAGKLSPQEAENHPDSHLLTQSLGGHLDPGRITIGHSPCLAGDLFLLCSDGLTGPVSSGDIIRVLKKSWPVQRQANKLIDLALSAGGPDNVTLQLIQPAG